jgi:uncharacterized protein (TIGR02246 family)
VSDAPAAMVLDRLVESWNRGDAEAFSDLFTDEVDYVSGAGVWMKGREAVREMLIAASPRPRVAIEGTPSIRDHGDLRTAVFRWAAVAPPVRRGVCTCVIVRRAEVWRIDRLQNTDARDDEDDTDARDGGDAGGPR